MLDYACVSEGVALLITKAHLTADVPWKPHLGFRLEVKVKPKTAVVQTLEAVPPMVRLQVKHPDERPADERAEAWEEARRVTQDLPSVDLSSLATGRPAEATSELLPEATSLAEKSRGGRARHWCN